MAGAVAQHTGWPLAEVLQNALKLGLSYYTQFSLEQGDTFVVTPFDGGTDYTFRARTATAREAMGTILKVWATINLFKDDSRQSDARRS
jgi:hypothetical protein